MGVEAPTRFLPRRKTGPGGGAALARAGPRRPSCQLIRRGTRCVLIARDAQSSKHSQRYVLVEGGLAYATTRPRRRSHCRDRFDFQGGSWPAIAKATLRSCDGGYAAPSRRDRFSVGRRTNVVAKRHEQRRRLRARGRFPRRACSRTASRLAISPACRPRARRTARREAAQHSPSHRRNLGALPDVQDRSVAYAHAGWAAPALRPCWAVPELGRPLSQHDAIARAERNRRAHPLKACAETATLREMRSQCWRQGARPASKVRDAGDVAVAGLSSSRRLKVISVPIASALLNCARRRSMRDRPEAAATTAASPRRSGNGMRTRERLSTAMLFCGVLPWASSP